MAIFGAGEKTYVISVQTIIALCSVMRFHFIFTDMNQVIVLGHVELLFTMFSHIISLFRILEKLSHVNILTINYQRPRIYIRVNATICPTYL